MCRAAIRAFECGGNHHESVAIARDLSGDANACSGEQTSGDEFLIEPDEANRSRVVGQLGFEYGEASFPCLFLSKRRDGSFKCGFFFFDGAGDELYA